MTPSYTDKFLTVIDAVLENEGGYSDNPRDPGGVTNWGITQRTWEELKSRGIVVPAAPVLVRNITKDDAIYVYNKAYWLEAFESLPTAVAYQVCDMGVNGGVVNGVQCLQRAIGGIKVDGVLGPKTLAAACGIVVPLLVARVRLQRLLYYIHLESEREFWPSWFHRVLRDIAD